MTNQDECQVENQDEKNTSCNIFLEQLELLNQLPIEERGNVIYLALLKVFSRTNNQLENQDDSQLENQLENIYISISKSISLSKLSISVLNLLNKTLSCKIYSKNWGGKRTGSGKKGVEPSISGTKPTKKIDPYTNSYIQKFKDEYKKVFGKPLYLDNRQLYKISELSGDIEDFENTIPIAISKLKDIDFGFDNYTPDVNWLLKDSNYTAVLNGVYDAKEKKGDSAFEEWYKNEKAKLAAKGIY